MTGSAPVKLTIGMCVYDDFDGVFFTAQSLLMHHNIPDNTEIIVIDNNPSSPHGTAIKNYCQSISAQYIPYQEKQSTSIRDHIFKVAKGKYTLCVDSHVLFCENAITSLLEHYDKCPETKDIISGPLCFENKSMIAATHMDPQWRDNMYGTWGVKEIKNDEPFEIPMMGLGAFSCKTSNWPGFNPNFTGFGGEEGYIHEKIRINGGKAICLPAFKWVHRFARPAGTIYKVTLEDRIWNYFVGWLEIKQNPDDQIIKDIYDHFIETTKNEEMVSSILQKAKDLYGYS